MNCNVVFRLLLLVALVLPVQAFAGVYAKTVVVAQSGGDFTNLNDAAAALVSQGVSANNRGLIKIMPGTYSGGYAWGSGVGYSYIDLEGSGEENTIITAAPGSLLGPFWLSDVNDVAVRALTIKSYVGATPNWPAGAYLSNAKNVSFSNVTIELIYVGQPGLWPVIRADSGSSFKLTHVSLKGSYVAIDTFGDATTTASIFDSFVGGGIRPYGTFNIVNSLVSSIETVGHTRTFNCYNSDYEAVYNGWH